MDDSTKLERGEAKKKKQECDADGITNGCVLAQLEKHGRLIKKREERREGKSPARHKDISFTHCHPNIVLPTKRNVHVAVMAVASFL